MENPRVLSASTLIGDSIRNAQGENLGDLKEIMLDTETGCVAYAVVSFGGFLGIGDKYFAVPWEAIKVSPEEKKLVMNVDKETFENAPGFDKDNWPATPDKEFINRVHTHYGYQPYWERFSEPHHH